jgi:pimeloyl-ACP methyl ester carboxylesterase
MSVFDWKRRTLRIDGDAIVPSVDQHRSPRGYRRIYILVHGFNNTPDQASSSYDDLMHRVENHLGAAQCRKIWEFYWPGYEEGFQPLISLRTGIRPASRIVTASHYHKQIPKAIEAGEKLGKYILQLHTKTQQTEVIFIGHSLGCRLILETLKQIEGEAPASKIPAILLMAAAVPVDYVQEGGSLRSALELCERRFALFSHRDWVLSLCFPPGQMRANDGGPSPEAVGWRGAPDKCWTGKQRTHLFHGQYWKDEFSTPNILRLFGKSTPHTLPYSTIVPWRLESPPPLAEWTIRPRFPEKI